MKIQIKFLLTYSSLFEGIFPASAEAALCFSSRNGKFTIRLWPDAETARTDWWSLPENPEDYHWYDTVIVELGSDGVDEDIIVFLRDDVASPRLEGFYREVARIFDDVVIRFVEFLNCVAKQYWVDAFHLTYTYTMSWDAYRILINDVCDSRWQDIDGVWRPFVISTMKPRQEARTGDGQPIDTSTALTDESWQQLQLFMQRGKPAPAKDMMIFRSMQHIWFSDKRDPRLATLEAVMALEAAIKQLLPNAIRQLPGNPNPTAESLDKLIQAAGLRLVVAAIFELVGPAIGLSQADIELCQRAVEKRNDIMHNGQRRVGQEEAESYVKAIHRVTSLLETRAFDALE